MTEEEHSIILQQLAEIHKALKNKSEKALVYDNSDVMRLLKVSQRTLATWREDGTIQYSKIGAKIYYKPEHIQEMIDKGMVKPNGI